MVAYLNVCNASFIPTTNNHNQISVRCARALSMQYYDMMFFFAQLKPTFSDERASGRSIPGMRRTLHLARILLTPPPSKPPYSQERDCGARDTITATIKRRALDHTTTRADIARSCVAALRQRGHTKTRTWQSDNARLVRRGSLIINKLRECQDVFLVASSRGERYVWDAIWSGSIGVTRKCAPTTDECASIVHMMCRFFRATRKHIVRVVSRKTTNIYICYQRRGALVSLMNCVLIWIINKMYN